MLGYNFVIWFIRWGTLDNQALDILLTSCLYNKKLTIFNFVPEKGLRVGVGDPYKVPLANWESTSYLHLNTFWPFQQNCSFQPYKPTRQLARPLTRRKILRVWLLMFCQTIFYFVVRASLLSGRQGQINCPYYSL